MVAMKAQRLSLKAIAAELQAKKGASNQPRRRARRSEGSPNCVSTGGELSPPEEGVMIGYSTKLDWHGGPEHG
jgi:hypothetical protein